jgi:hypothetical protein
VSSSVTGTACSASANGRSPASAGEGGRTGSSSVLATPVAIPSVTISGEGQANGQ